MFRFDKLRFGSSDLWPSNSRSELYQRIRRFIIDKKDVAQLIHSPRQLGSYLIPKLSHFAFTLRSQVDSLSTLNA